MDYFKKLGEAIDYGSCDRRQDVAEGDDVAALAHYSGTVRKTGTKFDHDWVMFWRFRGSQPRSVYILWDTREMTEAFGKTK